MSKNNFRYVSSSAVRLQRLLEIPDSDLISHYRNKIKQMENYSQAIIFPSEFEVLEECVALMTILSDDIHTFHIVKIDLLKLKQQMIDLELSYEDLNQKPHYVTQLLRNSKMSINFTSNQVFFFAKNSDVSKFMSKHLMSI